MDEGLTKIVQLNPSYFAFISGIAVSVAANLLTDLATGGSGWHLDLRILGSALLLFVAGVIFMILSWNLEEPFRKWKTIRRDLGWSEAKIREVAVNGKAYQLWAVMVIGVLLFLLGFVILFA